MSNWLLFCVADMSSLVIRWDVDRFLMCQLYEERIMMAVVMFKVKVEVYFVRGRGGFNCCVRPGPRYICCGLGSGHFITQTLNKLISFIDNKH